MKSKYSMAAGAAILAAILGISLYGLGQSLASGGYESGDHDRDQADYDERGDNDRREAMTMDTTYTEECGSCHLAYAPMLLPRQSWQRIMAGLGDHFGDNAELDSETRGGIEEYLVRESDRAGHRKLWRNLGDPAPLRITELPYFVNEHDEIPARMVAGNDRVKSLSRCNACHRDAERGRFDEDDVVIPGLGRRDD